LEGKHSYTYTRSSKKRNEKRKKRRHGLWDHETCLKGKRDRKAIMGWLVS